MPKYVNASKIAGALLACGTMVSTANGEVNSDRLVNSGKLVDCFAPVLGETFRGYVKDNARVIAANVPSEGADRLGGRAFYKRVEAALSSSTDYDSRISQSFDQCVAGVLNVEVSDLPTAGSIEYEEYMLGHFNTDGFSAEMDIMKRDLGKQAHFLIFGRAPQLKR